MLWNNWVAVVFGGIALAAFIIYHIMRELEKRQSDDENGRHKADAYDLCKNIMWNWIMPASFIMSAIFGGLSLTPT